MNSRTDGNGVAFFRRVGIVCVYENQKNKGVNIDKSSNEKNKKDWKDLKIDLEILHLENGLPKNVRPDKNYNFDGETNSSIESYAHCHSVKFYGGGKIPNDKVPKDAKKIFSAKLKRDTGE